MKNTRPDVSKLKREIHQVLPEITAFRRTLHEYPEKGLEEYQTAERIRKRLKAEDIPILPPYIGTDTVALLYGDIQGDGVLGDDSQGDGGSKNITLRADIDALELEDQSDVPWRSKNKGLAHSCGHDGHTAVLLGTALVLKKLSASIDGSVRFVFQPGEEGCGGGEKLVSAGVLDEDPKPEAVYALHGWPDLPLGTFSAKGGPYMAAQDRYKIIIKGKGGHGGKPHLAVDPIIIGTQVVQAFQTIVSRSIDPAYPAVVSVCRFQGGTADNVIPEQVELGGTVRYFEAGLKETIPKKMEAIVKGCCESAGAKYEFIYRHGYGTLINNPEKTDFVRSVAEKYCGPESWEENLPITTSSEDFSFYLNKVPGVFIRLGLGDRGYALHNPGFDFNDHAIETGITLLCGLVFETLR